MLKVDQAFVSSFIAAGFGLPIAHENTNYAPIAGTAFVELTVFPASQVGFSLSDANETTGVFQAVLRYPAGDGAIAAKTKADAVFAAFPIGSTVSYAGQPATITGHDRMSGRVDGSWFVLPCRLTFVAITPR